MTTLDGTLAEHSTEKRVRARAQDLLFGLACGAVTLLRLYYCTLVPGTTGDLPRHIFYGLYVNRRGLTAAGTPLAALSHYLQPVSWSGLPYNYPIVALHFFQIIALLSPTMFFGKLVLTTLDAASAVMIHKYTGQRWLSFLFWASPMSLWWVSLEGQFEPLQSFLLIAAIYALKERRAGFAFALLALAIQTKLTAAVMLPWFSIELWRIDSPRRWLVRARALACFAMAFAPSVYAQLRYPMLPALASGSHSLIYNPYFWNLYARRMFGWNAPWLIACNALSSYAFGLLLIALLLIDRRIAPYLGPLILLFFVKTSRLCQPWYLLTFMPVLLPIQNQRARLSLFALAPCMDVLAALQMFYGPLGNVTGHYYDNVTVFTRLFIPPP